MPDDGSTRWTVCVSKVTDTTVRDLIAQRGGKRGDLSKFIEDAVKWRMMDQTIAEARRGFGDMTEDELLTVIDKAVADAREKPLPNGG